MASNPTCKKGIAMTNTVSRRFFLSAAASLPATAALPQAGAVGIAMKAASAAVPATAVLRMIANRRTIEAMLQSLATVTSRAGEVAADHPVNSVNQVNQISSIMLHIDTIRGSGIEFNDFSESSLDALEVSSVTKNDSAKFNAQTALKHIQALSGSGCRTWQDVTKYLAKKSLPLLEDLENGSFAAAAKSSGTDNGISAAVKHISQEFEKILGVDFQTYKPAFEASSRKIDGEWQNVMNDIIHRERAKFSQSLAERNIPVETKKRAEPHGTPEAFRRKYDVEPLFPAHNKRGFFFRVTAKEGEHLTFIDLCRLSKQLTTDRKPPMHWPRQGGKDGIVISTNNRELAVFLSSCQRPAAMNETHYRTAWPEARL